MRSLEPVFRQRCSRQATIAGSGKSRVTGLTMVSGKLPTYGKCFRGISATALTLTYPDLRTATRLTTSPSGLTPVVNDQAIDDNVSG